MGLFDSAQNISDVPVKYLFKKLPADIHFLLGGDDIWLIEEQSNQTSSGAMNIVRKTNFDAASVYYNDIGPVIKSFKEKFDNIPINTNIDKTIPEQFGDILNSYLPKNSELHITPTKYFIAFNNDVYDIFQSIYQGYKLRYDVGQRGFDINPDELGYLHMTFTYTGYELYLPIHIDRTIHWFYPIAPADKDKS